MHKSQSLFNLVIAVHVLGVTITHLQEHKTTERLPDAVAAVVLCS